MKYVKKVISLSVQEMLDMELSIPGGLELCTEDKHFSGYYEFNLISEPHRHFRRLTQVHGSRVVQFDTTEYGILLDVEMSQDLIRESIVKALETALDNNKSAQP